MNWLIRQARIIDPSGNFHDQTVSLHVQEGLIRAIGPDLQAEGAEVVDLAGACVSPGWMDIGALVGDPGHEQREDLDSLSRAAMAGGYTALAILPNTDPSLHDKSAVSYIRQASRQQLVELHALGAISRHCKGQELTEMIDMRRAGALAFTDGTEPVQHAGLMLRALMYVKAFDGLVLNHPHDESIASHGQMHEGAVSTGLGLKGIPALSEELMIERDLHLLSYAGSRLHLLNVSTAAGVARVRAAKQAGMAVTASVPALNLLRDETALADFDSNYKVLPPLRSAADREALLQGLIDGTLDCVTSNHRPLEVEVKLLEYPYADFGASGLETAFSTALTALGDRLPLAELVDRLSYRPRRILGLAAPSIALGQTAELTIFDPSQSWTPDVARWFSKSANSPLFGQSLQGKVLGVINKGQLWRHPH